MKVEAILKLKRGFTEENTQISVLFAAKGSEEAWFAVLHSNKWPLSSFWSLHSFKMKLFRYKTLPWNSDIANNNGATDTNEISMVCL